MGRAARDAAERLRDAPVEQRSRAIRAIATHIRKRSAQILAANAQDVAEATTMVDRLLLNPERLERNRRDRRSP
jgi:glutamate-5-semialdehyde dehydrogenase